MLLNRTIKELRDLLSKNFGEFLSRARDPAAQLLFSPSERKKA